jgi:phosphoenolpyruvate synthase/pyruvate phosphate dikinase
VTATVSRRGDLIIVAGDVPRTGGLGLKSVTVPPGFAVTDINALQRIYNILEEAAALGALLSGQDRDLLRIHIGTALEGA